MAMTQNDNEADEWIEKNIRTKTKKITCNFFCCACAMLKQKLKNVLKYIFNFF